jgi:hypothetical protein
MHGKLNLLLPKVIIRNLLCVDWFEFVFSYILIILINLKQPSLAIINLNHVKKL